MCTPQHLICCPHLEPRLAGRRGHHCLHDCPCTMAILHTRNQRLQDSSLALSSLWLHLLPWASPLCLPRLAHCQFRWSAALGSAPSCHQAPISGRG